MIDPESVSEDAINAVDEFIHRHRAAAIPALVGACAMWAVENGGGDVFRQTLTNLIAASYEMEKVRQEFAQ